MGLGDGQGRAGLQYAAPSNVTVGVTSTTVLTEANASLCEYIALVNDSDEIIYLALGADAELNKGIRLNASGGAVVWETSAIPKTVINAICTSGSKNLCIQIGS
jgi:hypothetical protein